jgi:hypothetical protein
VAESKLTSPKVIVQFQNGTPDLEIQTLNPDLVLWDMTRVKHHWPPFQDAGFLWLTFISWAAARRTGEIPPDVTFESWRDTRVAAISVVDEDNETGDPTQLAAAPE